MACKRSGVKSLSSRTFAKGNGRDRDPARNASGDRCPPRRPHRAGHGRTRRVLLGRARLQVVPTDTAAPVPRPRPARGTKALVTRRNNRCAASVGSTNGTSLRVPSSGRGIEIPSHFRRPRAPSRIASLLKLVPFVGSTEVHNRACSMLRCCRTNGTSLSVKSDSHSLHLRPIC